MRGTKRSRTRNPGIGKEKVSSRILEVGIIPVIRASSADEAKFAAEAVARGGIPIVEITMTVPGAVEVIAELVRELPDVLVGAGTVLDARMAGRCLDAGAKFLVSPGLDLATVKFAASRKVVMMAGALTPTEVIAAWKAGSDFVKIFPCAQVGGPAYIKALKGPLPQVPLVPTGGVNLETAADFISAGAAALGVGGELIRKDFLQERRADALQDLAQQFVRIVSNARAATGHKPHSLRS
jgi:2-dehydro-3-deoxyphosphogluconate aldolase/(4S)-4-hydroxy-2-oxoglutarate aldolase